MAERDAPAAPTDGEVAITDEVFKSLDNDDYLLEFADSGNEILLTDKRDGSCYTITVKREEWRNA